MTYTNSQIAELIKEYIHDKTDRKILYLRFVDNDTIDEIAAKVGLDRKTVWRHIRDQEKELFSHLPG
jgi:DNA-directed RNA polymerase specialized sigma24 family protein